MIRSLLAAAAAITPLARPVQSQEPLRIARLQGKIDLDGRSTEAAWAQIQPLRLTMYQPTAGAEPSEPTEVRIAYDGEYLYMSGVMHLTDPGTLRTNSLYRDRLNGDDVFRILLDTFNDNENGVAFAVTPAGNRVDFGVSQDGGAVNFSWNSHWEVATAHDDKGWYAEFRIPLSTLRFRVQDGRVIMGMIVARTSNARAEIATFPAVSPRYSSAIYRVSLAQKIAFEGIEPKRPMYFTPYVVGGLARTAKLNGPAGRFDIVNSDTKEFGGDFKFGLTNSLTLDLTANTDFAQVEADDQQVNLSRFSLFFPEKRQFFQERSGLFDFETGSYADESRLFHSRRIGLADDGSSLRIYGGGRLVGRAGAWDLGVLDMHADAGSTTASENFGVVRMRRQFLNSGSYLGGILTSRLNTEGAYNLAYGTDAQVRIFSNDYVMANWAQTFDDRLSSKGLDAAAIRLLWERRSDQGLAYRGLAKWSGPDHLPEVGFQPRSDYTHLEGTLQYGWFPGQRTAFRNIQPFASTDLFYRNGDGTLESMNSQLYLNFNWKSGHYAYVGGVFSREDLLDDLPLSAGAVVPAGTHDFANLSAGFGMPQGRRLRFGVSGDAGQLYDGRYVRVNFSPTWNVSPHLELGLSYTRNRITFSQRDQRLDADILRLRVQAAANTKLSLNAFVQYNQSADVVVGNLRLRYQFREGQDLYVVYNERLNTDRERFIPALPMLPSSQDRTVLVKYTHTFIR